MCVHSIGVNVGGWVCLSQAWPLIGSFAAPQEALSALALATKLGRYPDYSHLHAVCVPPAEAVASLKVRAAVVVHHTHASGGP